MTVPKIETIIIQRNDWGATLPRAGHEVRTKFMPFDEVIVHHSIVPNDPTSATFALDAQGMRAIDRYHHNQGWGGYAYQFGITPSGRAFDGRGWWRTGAHTVDHNSPTKAGRRKPWGLGICIHMNGDKRTISDAAWNALADVIRIGESYGLIVPGAPIVGHRKYSEKSCPGDQFPDSKLTSLRLWLNAERTGR